MNYPIADFLIQLKNAYMARKSEITFPYSKGIASIGEILEAQGYVKKIETKEQEGRKVIRVELLYKNKKAALKDVKIISKPSVHIYVDMHHIPRSSGGLGITIVSTSRGIMTDKKARSEHVGGEVICQIF